MGVTVYGAGAIGGLTGAYLAKAGEDVLFVDRVAEHVDALNRQGIKITGYANFTARVRACLPQDLKGPLGLTFLAVKCQDTDGALDVLSPQVGPETVVVSFQNGMNPPKIAARIGPEKVIGAFINFNADWQGPGHVEHGGPGSIYLGELDGRMTDRLFRLQKLLSNMMTVNVTDNVYGCLWAKMIDASVLTLEAATDEKMADFVANREVQPLLIALCGEGLRVARAYGIRLQSFDGFDATKMLPRTEAEAEEARATFDRFADFLRPLVKQYSGVWRDIAVRHRPTETDYLTGWLIEQGKKKGIPMPLNEKLVSIIKELERGERQRSMSNVEELEAYRRQLYGPGIILSKEA